MEEGCYRIGDLARLAGVSQRTVDYYTRLELISPLKRTEGNYRIYDESAVRRLRLIKAMQAQRVPLSEIAARLKQSSAVPAGDLVERVRLIGQELAEAGQRLAALGVVGASAKVGEDERRALSKTASEALTQSLLLAQYLAALAGEGWPII